jgi:hypothetical protein
MNHGPGLNQLQLLGWNISIEQLAINPHCGLELGILHMKVWFVVLAIISIKHSDNDIEKSRKFRHMHKLPKSMVSEKDTFFRDSGQACQKCENGQVDEEEEERGRGLVGDITRYWKWIPASAGMTRRDAGRCQWPIKRKPWIPACAGITAGGT